MNIETAAYLKAKISNSSSSNQSKPKIISEGEGEETFSKQSEEDPFKKIFEMFQDTLELKQLELYKDTVRDSKKLFKYLEVVKDNFDIQTNAFRELAKIFEQELRKRPTFIEVLENIDVKLDKHNNGGVAASPRRSNSYTRQESLRRGNTIRSFKKTLPPGQSRSAANNAAQSVRHKNTNLRSMDQRSLQEQRLIVEQQDDESPSLNEKRNSIATHSSQRPVNIEIPMNHPLTTHNTPPMEMQKVSDGKKDMYIANSFVKRMRTEMQIDQDYKYQDLKNLVLNNVQKLSGFIEIADVAFPKVRDDAFQAKEKAKRANKALHVEILRKCRMGFKKEIWKKLIQYKTLRQKRREQVVGLLDIFRVFQKRAAFKKYRTHCYNMKEVSKKDSFKGAQLQLDCFRKQLSMFDFALEKLHEEKASKDDFDQLSRDFSLNRAQILFEDMTELLDTQVADMKDQIQKLSLQSDQRMLELDTRYQEIVHVTSEKQEQRINSKLHQIDSLMEKVVTEHGALTSKIGAQYTKLLGNGTQIQKYSKFKQNEVTQLGQQRAEINKLTDALREKEDELVRVQDQMNSMQTQISQLQGMVQHNSQSEQMLKETLQFALGQKKDGKMDSSMDSRMHMRNLQSKDFSSNLHKVETLVIEDELDSTHQLAKTHTNFSQKYLQSFMMNKPGAQKATGPSITVGASTSMADGEENPSHFRFNPDPKLQTLQNNSGVFRGTNFRPRSSHLTGKDKFNRSRQQGFNRAQRNYDIYNSQLLSNRPPHQRLGRQDASMKNNLTPNLDYPQVQDDASNDHKKLLIVNSIKKPRQPTRVGTLQNITEAPMGKVITSPTTQMDERKTTCTKGNRCQSQGAYKFDQGNRYLYEKSSNDLMQRKGSLGQKVVSPTQRLEVNNTDGKSPLDTPQPHYVFGTQEKQSKGSNDPGSQLNEGFQRGSSTVSINQNRNMTSMVQGEEVDKRIKQYQALQQFKQQAQHVRGVSSMPTTALGKRLDK